MKRLIWLPIAGFLLVAGAAVAAAAPSVLDAAKGAITAASPAPSADPSAGPTTDRPHDNLADGLLQSVLSGLVTDGTITQAQSDAITSALQKAIDDRQTQMDARRTLIENMISDGVITQDEINQLPADDPLRVAFDSIANNGQITLDQLRGLGPFGGPGGMMHGGPGGWMHGGPGGPMHGPFMWGPDQDNNTNPNASPSPGSNS
jgi:hypothetical protein